MNKTQHTPGPWTWEDWKEDDGPNKTTLQAIRPFRDDFSKRLFESRSPNGEPTQIVGCSECAIDTSEADKRLLAASPDLLEVLSKLVANHFTSHPNPCPDPLWVQAKELVARLEGYEAT